jgi:hypothetical protein
VKTVTSQLVLCLLLTACASWWDIRPYTDFVDAEIRPGDQLRVETRNGFKTKMVVVAVRDDRLIGQHQTILLQDIARLEKKSKTPPANPCSPQVPLGCSVPQWATLLHESQSRYQNVFYPSCEQHDFCYRHGHATYGKTRTQCDTEFLLDMQDQCEPDNLGQLVIGANDLAVCQAVALEFYQAVVRYGSSRFRQANSTWCEYDGPP